MVNERDWIISKHRDYIVLFLGKYIYCYNFQDHTKIILCPLLGAVTYIDDTRRNRTFRFDLLEKYGCSQDIAARLNYAYDKVCFISFFYSFWSNLYKYCRYFSPIFIVFCCSELIRMDFLLSRGFNQSSQLTKNIHKIVFRLKPWWRVKPQLVLGRNDLFPGGNFPITLIFPLHIRLNLNLKVVYASSCIKSLLLLVKSHRFIPIFMRKLAQAVLNLGFQTSINTIKFSTLNFCRN